jgi:hypothetical protein
MQQWPSTCRAPLVLPISVDPWNSPPKMSKLGASRLTSGASFLWSLPLENPLGEFPTSRRPVGAKHIKFGPPKPAFPLSSELWPWHCHTAGVHHHRKSATVVNRPISNVWPRLDASISVRGFNPSHPLVDQRLRLDLVFIKPPSFISISTTKIKRKHTPSWNKIQVIHPRFND